MRPSLTDTFTPTYILGCVCCALHSGPPVLCSSQLQVPILFLGRIFIAHTHFFIGLEIVWPILFGLKLSFTTVYRQFPKCSKFQYFLCYLVCVKWSFYFSSASLASLSLINETFYRILVYCCCNSIWKRSSNCSDIQTSMYCRQMFYEDGTRISVMYDQPENHLTLQNV